MQDSRRAFGSVFAPKFNLEAHINELHATLEEIDDVRELANHRGWLKVQRLLLNLIDQLTQAIVDHASQPEKNKEHLQLLSCQRTAYVTLIDLVNAPESKKGKILDTLNKRLNLLRETTGLPRASDLEKPPPMVTPASRI